MHLIERNPEIGEYVHKSDYCIATHDHMFPIPRTLRKLTKLRSLTIWYNTKKKEDSLTHASRTSLSQAVLDREFPRLQSYSWLQFKHLVIENTDFAKEDVVPPSTTPLPRKSVLLREYNAGLRSASATKKLVEAKRPDGLAIVNFTKLTKVTANCDNQEDIDDIQTVFIQAGKLKEIDLTSELQPFRRRMT